MKLSLSVVMLSWLTIMVPTSAQANALLAATLEAFRDARSVALDGVPLLAAPVLADFYVQRGYALAWSDSAPIEALLELVERSEEEGFRPEDFHVARLRDLSRPGALAALQGVARLTADVQLSDALLRYVHHTRYGKLDPVAIDHVWNDRPPLPEERLLADMRGALDATDLADFLNGRFQKPFWYQELQQVLSQYTAARQVQQLAPLTKGATLKLGSQGERVARLRERLHLLGYGELLPLELAGTFDASLDEAVRAFQRSRGLKGDGVVGPQTVAAVNHPVDEQAIARIRLNLERMRWLYDDLPPDYVFVDVANYMAHLVRGREIAWSTRVIVGKQEAQTPMFRDRLDHLVLNPTWTVPVSIQKKLTNVSAKYTLIDRRTGRRVSGGNAADYKRYRVVQSPGPDNALGRVKFMFPNRHAVYMHDTPSKALFGQAARALSHGCVRVQNPMKLAELLLEESSWDRARIDSVLEGTQTRHVNLSEPLPVLLYYLTARADAEGRVRMRPDIYGRDAAVAAALDAPVQRTRIEPYALISLTQTPTTTDDGAAPATDPKLDSSVRLTRSDVSER
ncbi:Murein L,D-transpeptidase YcbB/YkuD [Allochromatium warmingii]|uniref:Murein L,D-transpeptidase YcbB/YkuD n=1 Tax=Allochromatium warmingii TaxID=61595 RepID=A0A1H3CJZ5_ALLWA|nr:L,D-transpeptidase family protein [Allochromatium warmingii]SDX54208.1 Murein L,D-transpeptidase YcbB/YkuD [Allochromatium warmingii]